MLYDGSIWNTGFMTYVTWIYGCTYKVFGSLYLSIYPSIHLSDYLLIYLCIYVYLSFYLPVSV